MIPRLLALAQCFACCRSGIWDVMAEAPASGATDTPTPYHTMLPQNNAGVYLLSDEAAAFEDMRCRLEKLMQLDK